MATLAPPAPAPGVPMMPGMGGGPGMMGGMMPPPMPGMPGGMDPQTMARSVPHYRAALPAVAFLGLPSSTLCTVRCALSVLPRTMQGMMQNPVRVVLGPN